MSTYIKYAIMTSITTLRFLDLPLFTLGKCRLRVFAIRQWTIYVKIEMGQLCKATVVIYHKHISKGVGSLRCTEAAKP